MTTPLPSLVRRLTTLVVFLATVSLTGCSADPRSLLDEMSRTYRKAQAYSDNARVRIRYTREGTEVDQSIPFRVAFERPDRLRIDCYDARIAADGTSLRAAVGNVPGQVLDEPVKSPLTLDQLFADEQVRLTLAEGDAGCPTQLPLLLADDTVDLIVADAVDKPRIGATEQVEGHACTVVTIPKPDGPLVLWIDRKSKLLRRMALPTKAYGQFLTQQGGPVGGLSVVVDFLEAKFPATVPSEAFAFEVPAGAARVDRLEPPPTPQPPTALVGKAATPFVLAALDGVTVSSESLAGSAVVLEFFHTGCDACRRSMPQVIRAVESLTPPVKHFAVSVDETDVPDDALREKVRLWGGAGTILRDPRSVAATAFEIATFPAVVVLTPTGTVADVLLGHDHQLSKDLSATLAAVAAGTPTGPLLRDRFETRLRDYRELLEKVAGGGTVERMPPQQIAPRRQPDRFKLVRAWRAENVAMPGNVVCFDDDGAGRIVALDGWRTVVVLDPSGRELARHELDLPADAAVGFLRTAVDSAGKRWWLGGNRGGQQVFVFNEAWKLHAAYPGWESPAHAGIRTAQLVDLNDDGAPEIVVGYYGTVGVQAASLDGHRLWRERSFDTVLDVVPDAPPPDGSRGLICVNGHGRLVPVTMEGRGAEARPVEGAVQGPGEGRRKPDWSASPAVASLFAGPVAPNGGWAFLGLASPSMGKNMAVGLGPLPDQFWELDLPDGVHRDGPIEPVAWADLLGTPRRQWLIAAPDGSVTVAWADGRVVDRYRHGAPLVGIGGYRDGNEGFIVIATRDSLESYRVDDVALD
jgi:outer membrane lipoprotein-sorting protein/thiol-disulfide isomerase/thioredoxin